jgi:hypothetical protein
MATHDYSLANQSGASFRTDLNNALAAIVSNNSNSSSPSTTYAYQWWADTSAGVLKIRNSANNAWIELLQLDGTLTLEDGSASTPALAFRDDLNTGIFSGGADEFNISTGGTERFVIDSSGRVLIGGATTSQGSTNSDDLQIGANNQGNQTGITLGSASASSIRFADAASDSAGSIFFNHGTDDLTITAATSLGFNTNSAERMHIDQYGRLFVGTTTTSLGSSGVFGEFCLRGGTEGAGIHLADNDANVHGGLFTSDVSNAMFIRTITNHPIIFRTNNTIAMTLDISGRLLIGVGSSAHASANADDLCVGNNDSSSQHGITIGSNLAGNIRFADSGSGSAGVIQYLHSGDSMTFSTDTNTRLTIDGSGNIGAPSGTNIYNASDSRLKKNVVDLDKGLSAIKSLRPVSFNWIDGFCDDEKDTLYGFIAQEVETIDSNLIQEFGDGSVTVKGKIINDALRVNEKLIIPVLVKAVQELEAKVAALEAA